MATNDQFFVVLDGNPNLLAFPFGVGWASTVVTVLYHVLTRDTLDIPVLSSSESSISVGRRHRHAALPPFLLPPLVNRFLPPWLQLI